MGKCQEFCQEIAPATHQFTRDKYGRKMPFQCRSCQSQERHIGRYLINYDQYYTGDCLTCRRGYQKICKNRSGLTHRIKSHEQRKQNLRSRPSAVKNNLVSYVCHNDCKSLAASRAIVVLTRTNPWTKLVIDSHTRLTRQQSSYICGLKKSFLRETQLFINTVLYSLFSVAKCKILKYKLVLPVSRRRSKNNACSNFFLKVTVRVHFFSQL